MALPGVTTLIKDQFYSLSRTNVPDGTRIVVIAKRDTADKTGASGLAPVRDLDPVQLQSEDAVIAAFGDGSHAHRAFREVLSSGGQSVYVVALPSDTVFDYEDGDITSDSFDPDDPDQTLWDTAFNAAASIDPHIVVAYGTGSDETTWQEPATPGDDTEDYGFVADNSSDPGKSMAVRFANSVAEINKDIHPCLGVIGIKPFLGNSVTMTPAEVASHCELPNLVDKESLTNNNGIHIVVVAGEVSPVGYNFGFANGACTFAGNLSALDADVSPTAKPLYNIRGMRYNAPTFVKERLIEKGVVPIGTNYRRVPVWIDAMTFSKNGSDYSRITTIRIVNDATQVVRAAVQPFIGRASTLDSRNAMDTAITSGLRGMKIVGTLIDADHEMAFNPERNEAIIDLVLTVPFEIRTVEVRVSIQL